MRVGSTIAFLCSCSLLVGSAEAMSPPPFEAIRYKLPSASVALKLSLTLEKCQGVPIVSAEAAIGADAGAANRSFALTTSQLESARVKRTLNITLQDTGTISTIDSNVEDRTGSIMGNAIKFIAGVAGAAFGVKLAPGAMPLAPATVTSNVCSEGVQAALTRVSQIDDALAKWRASQLPANAKGADEQSKAMDTLAAERAALRVGILHVDLEAPLDLATLKPDQPDAPTTWSSSSKVDLTPLTKAWFAEGKTGPAIDVSWKVRLPAGGSPSVAGSQPADRCQAALDAQKGGAICFAIPAMAMVSAEAKGTSLQMKGTVLKLESSKNLPIPQWGTLQMLSLSAGFGSNRQLSLTLDKFGQASSMKWTSDAKVDNVMAGLAGAATQVSGIVSANGKLARQKAEIDELTTQQSLNRLRACREILAAGGSACSAEATTNDQ